jgi:hypothetical protein
MVCKQRPRLIQKEIIRVAGITVLMMLITSLPYVYGYLSAPFDRQFMGIALGTPDTTQYLTWMRGFGRSLFIGNQMTAEQTESVFFNLLWWLLGQLAARTGWSLAAVYQLFRLATVATFIPLSYWLCGLFLKDIRQRWTAFLLILLGAGLGWMLVVVKYLISGELLWPFDVYTVEPNSFLSLTAFPHFSNAATFIIIIFALDLFAFERQRASYAVWAGVVGLLLGFVHAYDLLLIYAVIGLFALTLALRDGRWREAIFYTAIVGLISCPGVFYSFYITKAFPTWRDVLAQFTLAGAWTPPPFHLFILLGLPFILALGTLVSLRPLVPKNNPDLFIKVWFIVHCFAIYLPVNYQIHYLNGWQFPIAILATRGLFENVGPWLRKKTLADRGKVPGFSTMLAALFILAVVPTNLYLFAWRFYDLGRHDYPYYLYRDEVAVLRWLDQYSAPDAVVLSSVEVGQYIPNLTGNRAFLAHWAMTLDLYRKRDIVQAFYSSSWSDAERRRILEMYQVQYVLWGQAEQALGTFDPASLPYLTQVFSTVKARLYRVDLNSMRSRPDGTIVEHKQP